MLSQPVVSFAYRIKSTTPCPRLVGVQNEASEGFSREKEHDERGI